MHGPQAMILITGLPGQWKSIQQPAHSVLKETVEEEQITYILFEEGMKFEEKECREDVIADTYPLVYQYR